MGLIQELRADCEMVYVVANRTVPRFSMLRCFLLDAGFQLCCFYRIAALLQRNGFVGKFLSKCVRRMMLLFFSCDIAPTAKIAGGIRMPHPIGIIVGSGVVVGAGAIIFQNVTLGSPYPRCGEKYPFIGKNCVIGCGAVILGAIRYDEDTVVKANSLEYET